MNRYLFAAITFAALLFTFLAEASACNRCGIFGRGCRFAHAPVHHAPHIEKAVVREASVQNFVFNNISPTGDLSPRGDTVYGLSRALDYNAPSSAQYQDNLRRLIDLGTELTVSSRDLDSNLTRALEIDAKGRAIEAGFRALASDTTSTATTRSVKVTIRDGQPEVTSLDEPQGVPREPFAAGLSCTKCHGPEGAAAKRFLMDGPLDFDKYVAAKAAVDAGTMPPKSQLSEAEKAKLVLQLSRLVPSQ